MDLACPCREVIRGWENDVREELRVAWLRKILQIVQVGDEGGIIEELGGGEVI